MFRKACYVIRMMLFGLVVQIASMANARIRESYNIQHEKQGKFQHAKNDLNREIQWNEHESSSVSFDKTSKYQLSLSGKLEPASDLPTIDLSAHSSRGIKNVNVSNVFECVRVPCVFSDQALRSSLLSDQ